MAKEIPILFSTPMVQAILDGRKTMTRRVVKFPLKCHTHQLSIGDSDNPPPVLWSKWSIGDILWVRESFKNDGWVENEGFDGLFYKADYPNEPVKWKPSIHMPKEACRIWLEVTNVRVERLREINPNDACDEGVEYWNIDGDALEGGELQADFKNYTWTEKKEDDPNYEDRYFPTFANPVDSFRTLWQSINGTESWLANPWVWVVEFKILSTTGKLEPTYTPTAIATPGEGAVIPEKAGNAPKTIWQLLTESFTLNELKAEVVERELDFPAGIITKLMNDEYYTNSVPVVLFKNLILSLHIRLSDVYKAMIPTFNVVLAKETPETIKKKPHGYQLWENKESVKKYTARLKELIENPESKLHLPSRGIDGNDDLMEELKKSEIN